jgi:hypothetical protein
MKNKNHRGKKITLKGEVKTNIVTLKKRLMNNLRKRKPTAVTDAQLIAFISKCQATVSSEDCSKLVNKLTLNTATASDIASFSTVCKVDDPSGGGGTTSGSILVTKVSAILIFLMLTIANLHFKE